MEAFCLLERCGDSEWSESADVDLLELLVKVNILERLVLLKTIQKKQKSPLVFLKISKNRNLR